MILADRQHSTAKTLPYPDRCRQDGRTLNPHTNGHQCGQHGLCPKGHSTPTGSEPLSWYDLPPPSPPTSSCLRLPLPPLPPLHFTSDCLHLLCLHSTSSTSALLQL